MPAASCEITLGVEGMTPVRLLLKLLQLAAQRLEEGGCCFPDEGYASCGLVAVVLGGQLGQPLGCLFPVHGWLVLALGLTSGQPAADSYGMCVEESACFSPSDVAFCHCSQAEFFS